jgi:hypothetical protein
MGDEPWERKRSRNDDPFLMGRFRTGPQCTELLPPLKVSVEHPFEDGVLREEERTQRLLIARPKLLPRDRPDHRRPGDPPERHMDRKAEPDHHLGATVQLRKHAPVVAAGDPALGVLFQRPIDILLERRAGCPVRAPVEAAEFEVRHPKRLGQLGSKRGLPGSAGADDLDAHPGNLAPARAWAQARTGAFLRM